MVLLSRVPSGTPTNTFLKVATEYSFTFPQDIAGYSYHFCTFFSSDDLDPEYLFVRGQYHLLSWVGLETFKFVKVAKKSDKRGQIQYLFNKLSSINFSLV